MFFIRTDVGNLCKAVHSVIVLFTSVVVELMCVLVLPKIIIQPCLVLDNT